MSFAAFPGYVMILLLLVPTLLYALLPLKEELRYSVKKTWILAGCGLFVIMFVFAIVGAIVGISFKWVVITSLFPVFVLFVYLTDTKCQTQIKVYCFFNATMILGNGIVHGMLIAAPLETDDSFKIMNMETCLVCIALTIALGLIYYKTLSVKMPYLLANENINLNYKLAILITVGITVLFFWVMPKYVTVVMTGRVRSTIITFLFLAPATFLLLYHTMWRVAVNLTENARLKESNELMIMEQKRYEEFKSYMDETRKLRHDFRQHLLVIDEYARKGENEKLSEYIGQFTESLKAFRQQIAANPALDAVASHYESVAGKQGTHIKWLIELPEELPIKEADYITVFGNLVENAIIAVRQLPQEKRTIQVNAKILSGAMMGLTVKNPYEGKIKLGRDGLPKSQKAGHGIGLASVNAVVARYNGTLEVDTKDGIFTAGVLLVKS